MIRFKIILSILFFPFLLFSQEDGNASDFLKKSTAVYKNAKAMFVSVDVNLMANDQRIKEYSFTCSTLTHGANRRLEIRNTVLIELDSFRLLVDHGQQVAELQSRSINNLPVEDLSQAWLENIDANLDNFIKNSKIKETEQHLQFSNNLDPEYAKTIYFFNKENFLLEKIIYKVNQDATQMPYDQLVLEYKTKMFSETEKIDYGLNEFIKLEGTQVVMQADYVAYEFFNLLKTNKK